MNFYTLTSKGSTFTFKQWIIYSFISSLLIFVLIFTTNYIVDPYKITNYNLLDIKHKITGDNRAEKVNYFSTKNRFDNILIGSSRVYSINPAAVTNLIGGTTYNFGIGSATIEDILGITKYLERTNKLPNNLIVGIDFYTFNKDIPANSYFLKNKELNFLSHGEYSENYVEKLFSFDAFKASIKTLKIHVLKKKQSEKFNSLGWCGRYEDYSKKVIDLDFVNVKKNINEKETQYYSDYKYSKIDQKRVLYLEELKNISKKNGINLYIFNTPMHPLLLKIIETNSNLKLAKQEFINYLNTFENFTNLYHDEDIYGDLKNFNDAVHTSSNAGDLILQKVLKKN